MSDKITPVLWFDRNAEEAANLYVSLLPDSRIDNIVRSPADNPSMKEGGVRPAERVQLAQGPLRPQLADNPAGDAGQLASDDRAAAGRAMEAMMTMSKLDVAKLRRAYEGETGEA